MWLDKHTLTTVGRLRQLAWCAVHYNRMEHLAQPPRRTDPGEQSAFEIWLGRTLRSRHEDAVNEPVPIELLEMLPPSTKDR